MDVSDLEFQDAKGKPVKKGRNLFRLSEWAMKTAPAIAPNFLQFPSFNPTNDSSKPQFIGGAINDVGIQVLIGPILLLIRPLTATQVATARLGVTWNFSLPPGINFLIDGSPGFPYYYAWAQVRALNTAINGRQFGMVHLAGLTQTSATFEIYSDDNSEFISTDQVNLIGFAIGLHDNA